MATIEAECIEEHAMRRISGKADGLEPGASITSSDKHTQESNVEEISEPEAVQYPTGATFWLLMGNLLAVVGLGAIDMSIVATAVPSITDHFHTVADVGWYAVAFRLTKCAFQFLYITHGWNLLLYRGLLLIRLCSSDMPEHISSSPSSAYSCSPMPSRFSARCSARQLSRPVCLYLAGTSSILRLDFPTDQT